MRNKEFEKAEEVLREVAKKDSMNFKCLFLLSAALRKQKKTGEALQIIRKALEVFPLYYPLLSELMLCSEKEGGLEFERIILAGDDRIMIGSTIIKTIYRVFG